MACELRRNSVDIDQLLTGRLRQHCLNIAKGEGMTAQRLHPNILLNKGWGFTLIKTTLNKLVPQKLGVLVC